MLATHVIPLQKTHHDDVGSRLPPSVTVTLLMSPKHVFVHQIEFVQSLAQLATVQAPQTHPKELWALFHTKHEKVRLKSLFGTYCSTQIRIELIEHPTTPAHWSSNNAKLAQLNDEIVQSNHLFTGGRLWKELLYSPTKKITNPKTTK